VKNGIWVLAVISTVCVYGFVVFITYDNNRMDTEGIVILTVLTFAATINLIALFQRVPAPDTTSWISLRLKRNRLEEEQRIAELEKNIKGTL
jgi:hypothetical protein